MSKYLLFSAFIFSLFSISCSSPDEPLPSPIPNPPPPAPSISYLALGDSYTIGESVQEDESYPAQMVEMLQAKGYDIGKPKIVAQTGWTTADLEEGIEKAEITDNTYQLVSLLIGVNNQFRNESVEDYRPEFTGLLEQAIDFVGGDTSRVFVISIPDYAFTPFGNGNPDISAGIDEFNAANLEITAQYGIKYFDITPISREGLSATELVSEDGLHPSSGQYRRWVDFMLADVEEILAD